MSLDDTINVDSLWDPAQEVQTTWSMQNSIRRRGRRMYGRRRTQETQFVGKNIPRSNRNAGPTCYGYGFRVHQDSGSSGAGSEIDDPGTLEPNSRSPTKVFLKERFSLAANCADTLDNESPMKNRMHMHHRAVSMSSIPKPLKLRRHQRSFSVSSSSTFSTSSNDNSENFWDPLGAFEANSSPKRMAGSHSDRRDRKKKRPSGYSSDHSGVSLTMFSNPRSFSQLSSFGEDDRVPLPGEQGYTTDTSASPANVSASSARRRNVCSSPLDDLINFGVSNTLFNSGNIPADTATEKKIACRDFPGNHRSNDTDTKEADHYMESDQESLCSSDSDVSDVMGVAYSQHTIDRTEISMDHQLYQISIKFLIKMLQKESRCVSKTSWTVSPPMTWEANHRSSFLHMAKQTLGFKIRNICINNNPILQISKKAGPSILKKLESILSSTNPIVYDGMHSERHNLSPMNSIYVRGNTRSIRDRETLGVTYAVPAPAIRCGSVADNLTDDLAKAMDNLHMNDQSSIRDDCKRFASGEYQIVIDDDPSFFYGGTRLSSEHHASARDLMSHMHGFSPDHEDQPLNRRIPFRGVGLTCTHKVGISPFQGEPMSVTSKSSIMNCVPDERMETPMVNFSDRKWGSRPIIDCDWGSSVGCNPKDIEMMFVHFKLAYSLHAPCIMSLMLPLSEDEDRPTNLCMDLAAESLVHAEDSLSFTTALATDELLSPSCAVSRQDTTLSSVDCHRHNNRRSASIAKHLRMSLAVNMKNPAGPGLYSRKSLFAGRRSNELISSQDFTPHLTLGPRPASRDNFSSTLSVCNNRDLMKRIFGYLDEEGLTHHALPVSDVWADMATDTHVELVMKGIGCFPSTAADESDDDDEMLTHEPRVLEMSWNRISSMFPWACFLSGGAFKNVYRVYNKELDIDEALSVMNVAAINSSGNLNVIGAELAVSIMLSSLVRRRICPNYILTQGVFSCSNEPPAEVWGSTDKKWPRGDSFLSIHTDVSGGSRINPNASPHGHFQYIRMELCDLGDAEEFMKKQTNTMMNGRDAQLMIFQIAFALHAAADRISLKHYDVKLLNVFLKRIQPKGTGDVVFRYGLGSRTFSLRFSGESAFLAKLADYGTANIEPESTGQPITIGQFTTLENTPPEFLFLGDNAVQGHGHDCFGLGLCMVHAFTGHAPYEEILENVICPINLKQRLRLLWESENEGDYTVIQGLIYADVYTDTFGNIAEGEPDEILYDTLYRYLVLFGPPDDVEFLRGNKVWNAVEEILLGRKIRGRKRAATDRTRFIRDQKIFSLSHGTNEFIRRARKNLEEMDGAWDILMRLVAFDPARRASALDVLNSTFMSSLEENADAEYGPEDTVFSYCKAFSTQRG